MLSRKLFCISIFSIVLICVNCKQPGNNSKQINFSGAYAENFYADLRSVEAAVSNGNYPSPPVRDLYFVCKQKPANPIILDYFKWILTNGQQFVKDAGYVPLPPGIIQQQLQKLQ
ncbi:MAG: hypothetical protein JO072_07440 [Parafilimonas sp.]|nr:hypothetical protein [Parafilimonas sp.]